MADRPSDGALIADQIDVKLIAFGRQAQNRSAEKETAIHSEIGKTLDLLADHPALQNDPHFVTLLIRLAGADGMQGFHDRVLQLDEYVRRVAVAHGVQATAVADTSATRLTMTQIPDHMSDLEEAELTRTRLNMR